jgi:hypothetical protein
VCGAAVLRLLRTRLAVFSVFFFSRICFVCKSAPWPTRRDRGTEGEKQHQNVVPSKHQASGQLAS